MKNELSIAVRPYECDMNGHVNHAVYVNYFELGRLAFLRQVGFDYEGMNAAGHYVFVHRIDIRYKSQARFGDELLVVSEPVLVKRVSGTFRQTILCGGRLVAEADVHWCTVDANGRPSRPPAPWDFHAYAD